MKKPKRKYERNPDPYESMVRAEKLDAYEYLINFNLINKKNNKSIEYYEFIVDEKREIIFACIKKLNTNKVESIY